MKKKNMLLHCMAMRVNAHVVNQWRRLLKVKELLLHLCQKQKQTERSFITGWVCRLFQTPRHCIYIFSIIGNEVSRLIYISYHSFIEMSSYIAILRQKSENSPAPDITRSMHGIACRTNTCKNSNPLRCGKKIRRARVILNFDIEVCWHNC